MVNNSRPNPYVGPRSFEPDEKLYGRDRELGLLKAQLISERIVLLHSQSGAGKTSLINAGLIPMMRQDNFDVLPVVRVKVELDADYAGQAISNPYTFRVLLSLEEGLPAEQRQLPADLARLSLNDYLSIRPRPQDAPDSELIIFDQFEEILTTDPTDREGKRAFFIQLGQALSSPDRWALFSIREDYIGELAPYVRPIPNRLEAAFRLERLSTPAAVDAVQCPAKKFGVDFTGEAVRKLVDDLSTMQVQKIDGTLDKIKGPYVEPVQLQVVCFRLWQTLAQDAKEINQEDVTRIGDVNESLGEYYQSCVEAAVRQTGINERAIREWFGGKLVTKEGIRSQVLFGPTQSEGLDNRAVRLLENMHVIRAEKRAGATWYELAHDRLVAPIQKNNAAWFEKTFSLFQRQALLWRDQGRSEDLLLRGQYLKAAQAEAKHISLTGVENEYLDACIKLKKRADRERGINRLLVILSICTFVLLCVASGFAFISNSNLNTANHYASTAIAARSTAEANEIVVLKAKTTADASKATAEANEAKAKTAEASALASKSEAEGEKVRAEKLAEQMAASKLVAQAISHKSDNLDLAMLLSVEAYKISQKTNTETAQSRGALLSALTASPNLVRWLPGHTASQYAVAYSPDGKMIASAGSDRFILLSNAETGQPIGNALIGHATGITSLAFSGDGRWLASADYNGVVLLWDLSVSPTKMTPLFGPRSYIAELAFSPDGKRLVSSGYEAIWAWDLKAGKLVGEKMASFPGSALSVAFNPASPGMLVAAVTEDDKNGKLIQLDVDTHAITPFANSKTWMRSLTFSPDGKLLASGAEDGSIWLWDVRTKTRAGDPLVGHSGAVYTVRFNWYGNVLASAGEDKQIDLWDVPNRRLIGQPFTGHSQAVYDIAFSPGGNFIASAGNDSRVGLWSLAGNQSLFRQVEPLKGLNVSWVDFARKQPLAATLISNGSVQLWNSTTWEKIGEPLTAGSAYLAGIVLNEDGSLLTAAGNDGKIYAWTTADRKLKYTLVGHSSPVMTGSFQPGGTLGISSDSGGNHLLWDVNTGKRLLSLNRLFPENLAPGQVTFSADGQKIIALERSKDTDQYFLGLIDTGLVFKSAQSEDAAARAGEQNSLAPAASNPAGTAVPPQNPVESSPTPAPTPLGGEGVPGIQIKLPPPGENASLGPLAVSPDGNLIAVAFTGGIDLVDLQSQSLLQPLRYPRLSVKSMQFSPKEKILVSLDYSNQLIFWDITSHQMIGQPVSARGTTLAFNQSGTALLVVQGDGKLISWDMSPDAWQVAACQITARNLTEEEWAIYLPDRQYEDTCADQPVTPVAESLKKYDQGNNYLWNGKYDQAVQVFKDLIAKDPQNVFAYTGLGQALNARAQKPAERQEAIKIFEKALKINPYSLDAYYGLANIYEQMQDGKNEVRVYQDYLALNPTSDTIYNDLGRACYNVLHDTNCAIKAYNQSLAWNKDNLQASQMLASIYNDQGKYDLAIGYVERLSGQCPTCVSYVITLGDYSLNAGRLADAVQYYTKAIGMDKFNSATYKGLSSAYLKIGDADRAVSILKSGVETSPKDLNMYKNLAEFYQNNGQKDLVIKTWQDAIDSTREADAYVNLGTFFSYQRDYRNAAEQLQKAVDLNPNNASVWVQLAWCHFYTNDYLNAEHDFKEGLRLSPMSYWFYTDIADFYQRTGQSEKALQELQNGISRFPTYVDIFRRAAGVSHNLGDDAQAETYYQKAIELAPNDPYTYGEYAYFYEQRLDNQKAVDNYLKAIALKSDYDWAWNRLGWNYYVLHQNANAEQALKKAIAISPITNRYYLELANFYRFSRQSEKALLAYQETLDRWPNYLEAYQGIGWTYFDQGNKGQAEAYFLKAIERAPKDAYSYGDYALFLEESGNNQKATHIYLKAIDLKPDYDWAWNRLGWNYKTLHVNNETEYAFQNEAEHAFQKAIDLSPATIGYYTDLGSFYQSTNQTGKALQLYQKVLDKWPGNIGALQWMRDFYHQKGDDGQAEIYFQKAIKTSPNKPDVYGAYGDILFDQQKYAQAVEMYGKAVELAPNNAWSWYQLSRCYNTLGDQENEEKALIKAAETSQSGWNYANLGEFYSRKNKIDQAIQIFTKAIELFPVYADTYRRLADMYYIAGDDDNALKYYKKYVSLNRRADDDVKKRLEILQR